MFVGTYDWRGKTVRKYMYMVFLFKFHLVLISIQKNTFLSLSDIVDQAEQHREGVPAAEEGLEVKKTRKNGDTQFDFFLFSFKKTDLRAP